MRTALPQAWNKLRREESRQRQIVARIRRRRARPLAVDPTASAEVAGLQYVADLQTPGIRRVGRNKRFRYLDPSGHTVTDRDVLARIKSLVIPPAWTDVWICPNPLGHLQATGRDARGRKQYRYHPRWRQVRDEVKYGRMLAFAAAVPKIRERRAEDLKLAGLPREKVLATVVELLEKTLIRVGNEEYARDNNSYGLTTLRDGHAKINGSSVRFEFRGKSGKSHSVEVHDPRLACIVKACRELPGYELFQYVNGDGQRRTIGSGDVNDYIRQICGESFTAKDFRTWAGTVLTACALCRFPPCRTQSAAKKNIVAAIKEVAASLGNTTAVCRKSYIHPVVFEAYMDGEVIRIARRPRASANRLSAEEAAVVSLLERYSRRRPKSRAA